MNDLNKIFIILYESFCSRATVWGSWKKSFLTHSVINFTLKYKLANEKMLFVVEQVGRSSVSQQFD